MLKEKKYVCIHNNEIYNKLLCEFHLGTIINHFIVIQIKNLKTGIIIKMYQNINNTNILWIF